MIKIRNCKLLKINNIRNCGIFFEKNSQNIWVIHEKCFNLHSEIIKVE